MRGSHPHLQSAEGMFHRLATYPLRLRVIIEAPLYSLQYVFMLPSRNSSLLGSSATVLDGAALTDIGPISA